MSSRLLVAFCLLTVTLGAPPLFAGGPLIIHSSGLPLFYEPGNVDVFTDLGPNGMLTNDESDSLATANSNSALEAVCPRIPAPPRVRQRITRASAIPSSSSSVQHGQSCGPGPPLGIKVISSLSWPSWETDRYFSFAVTIPEQPVKKHVRLPPAVFVGTPVSSITLDDTIVPSQISIR